MLINEFLPKKLSIGLANEYKLGYDADEKVVADILNTAINNLDKVVNNKDLILDIIKKYESKEKIEVLEAIKQKDTSINTLISKIRGSINDVNLYNSQSQLKAHIDKLDNILNIDITDKNSADKFIQLLRELKDSDNIDIKDANTLLKSSEKIYSYSYDEFIKIYKDVLYITNGDYENELLTKIREQEIKQERVKYINSLEVNIENLHNDILLT